MSLHPDDDSMMADAEACNDSQACDEPEDDEFAAGEVETVEPQRGERAPWKRVVAFGILPAVAILLGAAAGYLKWQDGSARGSQTAAAQSVRAATEDTAAMLSYRADTAEKDLTAARDRLTGSFRDAYSRLVNEVVIPGAKQKRISAAATVPAAASVSATENHAVVLVFVNQTTTFGGDPPTATTSSVRVTLDKVDKRWLVAQFEPI